MDQNTITFKNKPDLVSNAKILEKIKYDNNSEMNNTFINRNISETPTPSTDMMVNFLANSSKMISDDKQWIYTKNMDKESNKEYNDYINDINEGNDRSYAREMKSEQDPKLIFTGIENTETKKNMIHQDNNIGNDNSVKNENIKNENTEKYEEYMSKSEQKCDDIKIKMTNLKMQKLEMLRKLSGLVKSGVKLSGTYNMESDLEVMTYEYELHKSLRAKENATKFWCGVLINGIMGLEMMNDRYNPFDLHISGLSEQIKSEKENYLEVIGEIYEKYNTSGKSTPPEIKLVFMIFFSALQFHLAQAAAKQIPALDGLLKNAPGLLNILRQQSCANKETEVEKIHKKVNDLEYLKKKEMDNLQKEYKNMENESRSQKEKLRGPILNNDLLKKLMNQQNNNTDVNHNKNMANMNKNINTNGNTHVNTNGNTHVNTNGNTNINRNVFPQSKDIHMNDIRGYINPQLLNKNTMQNNNSDTESETNNSSSSSKSTQSTKSTKSTKSSSKSDIVKNMNNENNSNESIISFGKKRARTKNLPNNV